MFIPTIIAWWRDNYSTVRLGCFSTTTWEQISTDGGNVILSNLYQPLLNPNGPMCVNRTLQVSILACLVALQAIMASWSWMIIHLVWKTLRHGAVDDDRSDDEADPDELDEDSRRQRQRRRQQQQHSKGKTPSKREEVPSAVGQKLSPTDSIKPQLAGQIRRAPTVIVVATSLFQPSILLLRPLKLSLSTFACLALEVYYLKSVTIPYFSSPFRDLPTPYTSAYFGGYAFSSMFDKQPSDKTTAWIRYVPNNGLIRLLRFPQWNSAVLLTTPEGVHEVLNIRAHDYSRPRVAMASMELIVGRSLISVDGQEHRDMRRFMNPAFRGERMKRLAPGLFDRTRSFANWLALELRKEGGRDVDVQDDGGIRIGCLLFRYALDGIGSIGLSLDLGGMENPHSDIVSNYAAMDPTNPSLLIWAGVMIFLPAWIVRLIPGSQKWLDVIAGLRSNARKLLNEKLDRIRSGNDDSDDIMSTMIRQDKASQPELVDHVLTDIGAG